MARLSLFAPAVIAAAVALSLLSVSSSAATIVPTGGSVQFNSSGGSSSLPVPAAHGNFSAAGSPNDIDWSYSLYEITLHPTAYQGSVQGMIGLDLTSNSILNYSFLQSATTAFWNVFDRASLTIHDAQGAVVFGCTGGSPAWDITFGGCAAGTEPQPTPFEDLLPDDGFIALLAGHYDIRFATASDILVGVPVISDFDFSLTVVPLPAALPLLLSGLSLLGMRRRSLRAPATAHARLV